ncbi:NHX3, partial [Symbiodinium pilosum]
ETKMEVTQLQTAFGLLEAERRRTPVGSPVAQSKDTGVMQVSDAALLLRVEALEAQVDGQVPRSLQVEAQVKELQATIVPLGNRMQALEAELRKWDWDTTAARLNAAEAEITRLGRDNNFAEGVRSDAGA